jgi:hypothetical protein
VSEYRPTPRQARLHLSVADELLYGGAAGGGKSAALVMEALAQALEHPGMRAYLFRRTYPQLESSLIEQALRLIPRGLGRYSGSSHSYTLNNGSKLLFRHCNKAEDRFSYQGAEIHGLFLDELTHFPKEVYDFLKSRLRAPSSLKLHPMIRTSANPGGIGHAWVKSTFIDPAPKGGRWYLDQYSPTLKLTRRRLYEFIPAKVTDNPHLGPEYTLSLESLPQALKSAYLDGNWDAFAGQVFSEWRDDSAHYHDGQFTHVIAPFPIPAHWPRVRSFDFGYARPFSVGWWAVAPDHRVYRYREWYGCVAGEPNVGLKLNAVQIARGILERELPEREAHIPVAGVADPAIWDSSRGESVAEQLLMAGVAFDSADHARLSGKMQLHARLALDNNGRPGLYVFSCCKDFIRTVPALVYSPGNVEDVDTEGEDHIYDETRYFLMTRPLGRIPPVSGPRPFNPLA